MNKVICNRCNNEVIKETEHMEDEYPWYCPNCDENMFNFEVTIQDK